VSCTGLPDDDARRLAQRELERPVAVEAGAGTGKTALLVARIAGWCVGPGWERHAAGRADPATVPREVLDRLVAITFTEAAAAEMAARVATAFDELAAGGRPQGFDADPERLPDDPGEIGRRARLLLEEIDRLRVHTIHAFCQRLLRAYPLEAGLHPRFEVDGDGRAVAEAVADAVEQALRDGRAAADPGWRRLAAAGCGPARVVSALEALVAEGFEPGDLEHDPFDRESARLRRMALEDALDWFTRVEGGGFRHLRRSPRSVATREALDRLAAGLAELAGEAGYGELAAACRRVDDEALKRLREWSRAAFNRSEEDALGGRAAEAADAASQVMRLLVGLRSLAVEELGAAREVLGPLLRTVRSALDAAGVVTYVDLLTRTLRLLEGSPGVLSEVRRGLDQLLVDEFQDTDRAQCRIVEVLALDAAGDGPRPALFVVGDPKQSIYGWRRADLAAYQMLVDRIVGAGGTRVSLTANFRSVEPILDEVERLVAPVMVPEPHLQPPFERLRATFERIGSEGFERPPWSAVEHWIGWGIEPESGRPDPAVGRSDDAVAREAVAIAADLRRLHDEAGVAWGDAAVLLRTTGSQESLLDALRAYGVPHEVAREREYYRQREVVEAASLVRCVLEPGDGLALLAVLRSDLGGVPDGALAPLWDAGFAARMAEVEAPGDEACRAAARCLEGIGPVPGEETLPCWRDGVRAAVEVVAALRAVERSEPPDRFVAALRRLSCAEVTAAARYLGDVRVARLERFFDELALVVEETSGSPAAVARFLRRAVEEGAESRLPPEPAAEEADAVHVMTVHAAKGLDFEHVYLAQIHKRSGAPPGRPVLEVGERGGASEYALFGWPTPGMEAARERAARRSAAENVRLLYVAATRAKRRLVVSGWWSDAGREVPPEKADCFGDLVARRGDRGQIDDRAGRGAGRWDDGAACVQWRLPALEPPAPPPARSEAPAAADLVGPARRDAARLAALRGSAARRSSRPLTGRMSEEAHRVLEPGGRQAGAPEGRDERARAGADAAAAAGTAIHTLLEELDLEAPLAPQVAARRAATLERAAAGLDGVAAEAARDRAGLLVDRLLAGGCLARLEGLAGSVLGREVPLVAPAGPGDGAVVAVLGSVDLLYRDPADGRAVVADYKTDAVSDERGVAERSAGYAPQLARYAATLQRALGLEQSPRRELWFLQAGAVVDVTDPR